MAADDTPAPETISTKIATPAGATADAADESSIEKREAAFDTVGTSGLKVWSGVLNEEFLVSLRGERGQKAFREMSENDPTIGAMLAAIVWILSAVTWTAERNPDAPEDVGQAEAEFAESLFADMSHTFEDFIAEALTMLVFGWQLSEIVLKRRVGPLERDPAKRSKYDDGRIGVRKLAPRSQDTLDRWELQPDGGIDGMWQRDDANIAKPGNSVLIEIDRALLFRTTSRKNSPEGVSVLRSAYRAHYFHKRIQESEAIGIERELAGLPLVRIPSDVLNAATAENAALKAAYTKIARDLKFNQQGGLVIPSDLWKDKDGNPSQYRRVDVELLKTGGARTIDTVAVKQGYQRDMARSVLADFLLLGTDKGAFNLAENKTSLFFKACETFLNRIAAVLNMFLLPRIWDYNGLDRATLPTMKPGRLAPVDIKAIGELLKALSAAGDTVFPDDELGDFVREEAELPPKSEEAKALQDEAQQREIENAAALALATQPPETAPPPGGE